MKRFSPLKILTAITALSVTSYLFAETQVQQYAEGEIDIKRLEIQENLPEYSMYVSGGGSFFLQDAGSTIGKGAAFRFALGIQHNTWFDTEWYTAKAPQIDPNVIIANLRDRTDQDVSPFDIRTRQNTYRGVLGTLSFDLTDHVSLVKKFGIAKYAAHRVDANVSLGIEDDRIQSPYRNLEREVKGYTPVISFSVEIPFPYRQSEHSSMELMSTYMLDDSVKSLSFNISLKYLY